VTMNGDVESAARCKPGPGSKGGLKLWSQLLFASAVLVMSFASSAQQVTVPLWPAAASGEAGATTTERDITKPSNQPTAGKRVTRLTDITHPSLAVFKPAGVNEPVPAVLVFPGGGYQLLAYDLEGTEVCDWLNSIRVACVVVKYRVPIKGRYPEMTEDLEDAQQALSLTWKNASEWGIDKSRIGVLGFSAGAHLAAVLSNHPAATEGQAGASGVLVRPAFALILYPGYLAVDNSIELVPSMSPTKDAPPTFLLQTEDDPVRVENVLAYFIALKAVHVPAELHVYASGGHGYGLRPTDMPVTRWPKLAEEWLSTNHILTP
jgi:acetyl esterase/lipase